VIFGSLQKTGTGTWAFSGTNSIFNGAQVQQGTLQVQSIANNLAGYYNRFYLGLEPMAVPCNTRAAANPPPAKNLP